MLDSPLPPLIKLPCTHKFLVFYLTGSSPLNLPTLGDFEPRKRPISPQNWGVGGAKFGRIISKHFLSPKPYLEPPPKPGILGEPGTLERGRLPSGKVIKIRSFSCKPERISVLSLTVKPVLIGTNSA